MKPATKSPLRPFAALAGLVGAVTLSGCMVMPPQQGPVRVVTQEPPPQPVVVMPDYGGGYTIPQVVIIEEERWRPSIWWSLEHRRPSWRDVAPPPPPRHGPPPPQLPRRPNREHSR